MSREALREALGRKLRASGRFSGVEEVEVETGPKRPGLAPRRHRVSIAFAPTVRVTDPDRYVTTVRSRFEKVFPTLRIEGSDYEAPEPAAGVVEEENLRIRPARGPTVVLSVGGLADRLREETGGS